MSRLEKKVIEALNAPETIKTLTTIDDKGVPHTVVKGFMVSLDDETIAYPELIETSRTQRNMLRNYWWGNKMVAVCIFNKKKDLSYQIKGELYKFAVEGPIFKKFLDMVWNKLPDADPSGVWLISVKEVINQDFTVRREEESKRRPGSKFWNHYMGQRP